MISASSAILDAYTLRSIDDEGNYGKERLWGAVSWALAAIFMGLGMDLLNSPLNISIVTLLIGSLCFIIMLRIAPHERKKAMQSSELPSITGPPLWRRWMFDFQMLVFLFIRIVMGAATSLVENLLFLFMREDLGATYSICGVSVVITVMFEIPLFYKGKALLKSIGTLKLLLGGMFCYITRVVCYTLLRNPWTILFVGK